MTALADQFAETAGEYGVTVTRVPPADAGGTLADAVEVPAVGVSLPWEDVSLPECVDANPTGSALERAKTGVTAAAFAVADYGTLALRPTPAGSEPVSLYVDHHVAVLRAADILPDMASAFDRLESTVRETGGSAVLATGPSATADMGALVQGAHGPKTVEVVLLA